MAEHIIDLGFYEAVHDTKTGFVRIGAKGQQDHRLCFLPSELLPIAKELVFAHFLNGVKK